MKIKLLLSFLVVLALTGIALSQSVTITPKRSVYRRPKPASSYKKTFSIRYPKISGLTPALNKKVESAIGYERVLKINIKEEMTGAWLEEADYKVNYNKLGVLDITLMMSGSAAYPSDSSKTVVIDLKTGNRVTPQDVFSSLNGLTAMCRKAQKAEIARSIKEIKKDDPDEADPESLFNDADFKAANLKDFSVNDKGVAFLYDYGFPHVVMALQPAGRYSFTWKELKPFIKPGGLLQRLVR